MKPASFDITGIQIQSFRYFHISSIFDPPSPCVGRIMSEGNGQCQIQGQLVKKGLPYSLTERLTERSKWFGRWLSWRLNSWKKGQRLHEERFETKREQKKCVVRNILLSESKQLNAYITYLTWCLCKCGQCWSTMSRFRLELMIVCK